VSERCEGCGSDKIAGHTLDDVALCPRCAPVQPAPDGERVAEYERLTRAQLETCLLGLLARVAEESTGAAVRFAPLERGVTDVMELFDYAAPKQDALREAAVTLAAFARTAPGRLPQRVQDALAAVERAALATEGGSDA
jgi:hypothetical protein